MIDLTGKKVSRYARVSTDDKDQSTENQFIKMDWYCEVHGITDYIDYDDEQSGKSLERPGWQNLLAALEEKQRDGILITTPDRYSRNLTEALDSIEEILETGRFIIFSDSGLILDKYPLQEDLWSFLAFHFLQAEYYRRHLSSNTKAGTNRVMKEIEEHGFHISSKTGNKITSLGRPTEVKVTIDDILPLRDQNLSLQQIADKLGSKKSTIQSILRRHFS